MPAAGRGHDEGLRIFDELAAQNRSFIMNPCFNLEPLQQKELESHVQHTLARMRENQSLRGAGASVSDMEAAAALSYLHGTDAAQGQKLSENSMNNRETVY